MKKLKKKNKNRNKKTKQRRNQAKPNLLIKKKGGKTQLTLSNSRGALVHLCSLQFSLWRGKFFDRLEKKTPELHHLFSFLHIQLNTLKKKKISSHFLFKVFHPPYFTSKQTHFKRVEKSKIHCDTWFSKIIIIIKEIYFLGVTYTLRILLFTPKDF